MSCIGIAISGLEQMFLFSILVIGGTRTKLSRRRYTESVVIFLLVEIELYTSDFITLTHTTQRFVNSNRYA